MTIRQGLTAADRRRLPIGARVRYRPGYGTYGFEDCLEADGRLPGVVRGYTETRVRIELTLAQRWGATVLRVVNAAQLTREDVQPTVVPAAGSLSPKGGD